MTGYFPVSLPHKFLNLLDSNYVSESELHQRRVFDWFFCLGIWWRMKNFPCSCTLTHKNNLHFSNGTGNSFFLKKIKFFNITSLNFKYDKHDFALYNTRPSSRFVVSFVVFYLVVLRLFRIIKSIPTRQSSGFKHAFQFVFSDFNAPNLTLTFSSLYHVSGFSV